MELPGTESLQLLSYWDFKTCVSSGKIKFWKEAKASQLDEISGSHGGECEDSCVLGCWPCSLVEIY
jgi:hypothetical protein